MKFFKTILLLSILTLTLSGCSFIDNFGGLKWLDEKAGNLFDDFNNEQKKSVMEFMEENKDGLPTEEAKEEKTGSNSLSAKDKEMIDAWLLKKGFNRYGDDKSAIYTGGTPLFNEKTGEVIDRYDYILNKFPDILERIGEE